MLLTDSNPEEIFSQVRASFTMSNLATWMHSSTMVMLFRSRELNWFRLTPLIRWINSSTTNQKWVPKEDPQDEAQLEGSKAHKEALLTLLALSLQSSWAAALLQGSILHNDPPPKLINLRYWPRIPSRIRCLGSLWLPPNRLRKNFPWSSKSSGKHSNLPSRSTHPLWSLLRKALALDISKKSLPKWARSQPAKSSMRISSKDLRSLSLPSTRSIIRESRLLKRVLD